MFLGQTIMNRRGLASQQCAKETYCCFLAEKLRIYGTFRCIGAICISFLGNHGICLKPRLDWACYFCLGDRARAFQGLLRRSVWSRKRHRPMLSINYDRIDPILFHFYGGHRSNLAGFDSSLSFGHRTRLLSALARGNSRVNSSINRWNFYFLMLLDNSGLRRVIQLCGAFWVTEVIHLKLVLLFSLDNRSITIKKYLWFVRYIEGLGIPT